MIINKATNTINNKVYIGLTVQSLEIRISEHKSRCNRTNDNRHFYNAIRKYGLSSFKWEVVDSALLYDDLKAKEIYWIQYYDSYNNGYNSTIGGDGIIGVDRKGEKNSFAKINDKIALEIISLLKTNKPTKEIAEIVEVSQKIVQYINYGATWTHLYEGEPPSAERIEVRGGGKGEHLVTRTQVTESQVIAFKRLLSEKVPATKIAKQFDVGKDVIHHIKNGSSWAWL